MTALIDVLEALGSFAAGLAGRFGLFFVAALALVAPALVLAVAWRALLGGRRDPSERSEATRLAPNHTWVEPRRGGVLRVGLDELAARILPSATAVELPRPGMVVHRGDPVAVVRAGARALRIGAPVDGEVVVANARVRRDPSLVKLEPYGGGWLFGIAPGGDAWTSLPAGDGAERFLRAEKRRLAGFLEEELGLAAADGGELPAPAPALLGEAGWKRVVSAFLGAA